MAGKVAKKGDAKAASGGKRGRKPGQKNTRKGKRTWTVYVCKGMRVVNSFVQDIFERIAVEAASLTRINKTKTLSSREIQTAVRLVLPAELAKHAMAEGTKAVAKAASK